MFSGNVQCSKHNLSVCVCVFNPPRPKFQVGCGRSLNIKRHSSLDHKFRNTVYVKHFCINIISYISRETECCYMTNGVVGKPLHFQFGVALAFRKCRFVAFRKCCKLSLVKVFNFRNINTLIWLCIYLLMCLSDQ